MRRLSQIVIASLLCGVLAGGIVLADDPPPMPMPKVVQTETPIPMQQLIRPAEPIPMPTYNPPTQQNTFIPPQVEATRFQLSLIADEVASWLNRLTTMFVKRS